MRPLWVDNPIPAAQQSGHVTELRRSRAVARRPRRLPPRRLHRRPGSSPIAVAAGRMPRLDPRESAHQRQAVLPDRGRSAKDRRRSGIAAMARLSVNLNKVALLRNSRRTGVPDVLRFGRIAHDAGADGLTAHPRPDERHIRRTDVLGLAELMRPWRPGFEFNIEGYPDRRYLDLVAEVLPEQCTLVPDAPDVLTSEEGWKLTAEERRLLNPVIPALKGLGRRVILFVDPDPAIVERVRDAGADGIELYTGSYAAAFRAGDLGPLLQA